MPPVMTLPPDELLERYDTFLIDAYGVLVTSAGVVPGAREVVARLQAEKKRWCVVTNDASRLPDTCAEEFGGLLGIQIDPRRVVTAGSMLAGWVTQRGLRGAPAFVLGPADSREYAERAGLELTAPSGARVFIVGAESGFEFLSTLDAALSAMIQRIQAGSSLELVCPNADRIYPKGDGGFGLTAGAMADMLVSGLQARFPERRFQFEHLGKPNPEMFREGLRRAIGSEEADGERGGVVVVGDTPATDVAGANAAGFDVVLFGNATPDSSKTAEVPTWHLRAW